MFTLYSDKIKLIFDPSYSKHEAIDLPYNQRTEQKLLIDYLSSELRSFKNNGIKGVKKKKNNFSSREKHTTTNNKQSLLTDKNTLD